MTTRFTHVFLVAVLLFGAGGVSFADEIRPFRWEESLDLAKVNKELVSRLGKAQANPGDFELRINICMAAYAVWRLDKHADYRRRLQVSSYALKYAKEMVAMQPENAASQHWLGVGIGMVGVTRGILNSLQLVPEVKAAFEKSAKLDPAYLDASALTQLGRLYTVLPGFPVSIGNRVKAIEMLQLARKHGGIETLPLLYLADLYWMTGHNEKALETIEAIFKLEPKNAFQYFSHEISKRKAAEMRGLIQQGFERSPFYDVTSDNQSGLVH